MRELNLHTVCEEAQCRISANAGTTAPATFMILGDICTRACSYCAVSHGRPASVDTAEPARVANAIRNAGPQLRRDHIGGPRRFAGRWRIDLRRHDSRDAHAAARCRIEVLIPDFQGNEAALHAVLDARPDILNHNTETVPRLYRMARSGGRYPRTLDVTASLADLRPGHPHKSGLMVGLGEEKQELLVTLEDCVRPLRHPDDWTVPPAVRRPCADGPLLPPDEFRELKERALAMGFAHVESGPLVRSSYHAHETADAYAAAAGNG